jgi:hypothetical protein
MTRIGDGKRVDEAIWQAAREQFNDEELAALLLLVGLINVWNRINVGVELPSERPRAMVLRIRNRQANGCSQDDIDPIGRREQPSPYGDLALWTVVWQDVDNRRVCRGSIARIRWQIGDWGGAGLAAVVGFGSLAALGDLTNCEFHNEFPR